MAIIKSFIAPFQKVLIRKNLCPGCTSSLKNGKKYEFSENKDMIICSCHRMFIYDQTIDSYRRATIREAEMFSKKR